MKIIRTNEMDPGSVQDAFELEGVYNGLDCCVTHDVFAAIHPQLDPITTPTYDQARALQGPVLEMRIRGVLVDQARKMEVIDELWELLETLEAQLNSIVFKGVGMSGFNWRSPKDLRSLFYETLGIPPVRRGGVPTVDRGARESLEVYPVAAMLVKYINAMTELGDKISVLRTAVDDDGRIRTSYNIAGTSTGRFSSSLSEFGTGGNLQNVEESLRSIFIADPGYKFAKFDAKSGESFCVGATEWNLFGDPRYLDACESGDPHTAVARICWPGLPWTGDLKRDKEIAERNFYRHYTYRFMCKKLGHGSNYGGQPDTLSEQTRVPINLVTEFQPKYFRAFPAHQRWHEWVQDTLRRKGCLTTLTGRRRYFFGRRTDPKVYREALAYDPQGSLADIVNRALIKLWRMNPCPIVFQDHDALTFMYPEADEPKLLPLIQSALTIPIALANNRTLRIPYDCEVGWNKGKYDAKTNPDGLRGYEGHETRKRSQKAGIMDRIIHRANRKPRGASYLPAMGGDLSPGGSDGTENLDDDILGAPSESLHDDRGQPWSGEDSDPTGGEEPSDVPP